MDGRTYEILIKLERRTNFIVNQMQKELAEAKQTGVLQEARILALESQVTDVMAAQDELKDIVTFKRNIRRFILFVATIMLTAALTTTVNLKTVDWFKGEDIVVEERIEGEEQ